MVSSSNCPAVVCSLNRYLPSGDRAHPGPLAADGLVKSTVRDRHHLAILDLIVGLFLFDDLVLRRGTVGLQFIGYEGSRLQSDGQDVRRTGADVLHLGSVCRVRRASSNSFLLALVAASACKRACSASRARFSFSFARLARISSLGGTSTIPESTASTGWAVQPPMTRMLVM